MKQLRPLLCIFLLTAFGNGQQLAISSSPDELVRFHERRIEQRPDDVAAYRFLAQALVARAERTGSAADYDRASVLLGRADALEPDDHETVSAEITLLLSRHRFPQARALAENAIKRFPKRYEMLAFAGDAAFHQGDFKAAQQRYQELHRAEPGFGSWSRLSSVSEALEDFATAAKELKAALEDAEKHGTTPQTRAWGAAILGELELRQGRPAAARKIYSAALAASPNHRLVSEHLAELEELEGNLVAAISLYQKMLEVRPEPELRLRMAAILDRQGKRDEAAALRSQAHEFLTRAVAEGNEGYLRPLAKMELQAGRFEKAAQYAARDVALRPTVESLAVLRAVLDAAAEARKPITASMN